MKEILESEFTFFKAGQGTFYGGKIWLAGVSRQFRVIYDCGTSRFVSGNSVILNNEIDFFKNFYCAASKDVDILFVSHLDYDHVSGVKRLLTEFNVKRIVLPYFPMHVRQFFLISIYATNDPEEDDLSLNDYTRFVENPYRFIKEVSETTDMFIIDGERFPNTENYYEENNDEESDNAVILPKGEKIEKQTYADLTNLECDIYANNLQFFIQSCPLNLFSLSSNIFRCQLSFFN